MNRYLLEISYIGTRFRGIQKTVNKLEEACLNTTTIQGCIELALRVFRPVNEIQTVLSSRKKTFDVDRMKETSRMLLGRHDFRTFMSVTRQTSPSRSNPMFTVRNIHEINIKPGKTTAIGPNAKLAEDCYEYWDIEIKAKSFLYKQVRRMVGALLAVGADRINEKCVYEMLTIPSKNTWNPHIILAPAFGLYLCRVHYNENDLKLKESPTQNTD